MLGDCDADIQPSDELVEQLHNILVSGTSAVTSSDPSRAQTENDTSETSPGSKLLASTASTLEQNVCDLE